MSATQALTWWRARPLREKVLLAGGCTAALLALGDATITAPMDKQLKRARADTTALESKLQGLVPASSEQGDPRQREAALREQLQQMLDRNLQLRRQLADAARLPETLRAITATVGSARLLELDLSGGIESAGAAAPAPGASAAPANPAGAGGAQRRLYRLPITLKVAGNYAELQTLLAQIEHHAQALQWTSLTLDNGDWPAIQLTLKAHVLSAEPRWGAS